MATLYGDSISYYPTASVLLGIHIVSHFPVQTTHNKYPWLFVRLRSKVLLWIRWGWKNQTLRKMGIGGPGLLSTLTCATSSRKSCR